MRLLSPVICLLGLLLIAQPLPVQAFWGGESDRSSGLNLENGYDANTVTTLSGRVVSVAVGDERRSAQVELQHNGSRSVVILGPGRYWTENGIVLKVGDELTVRGSKAQGDDGVVYLLAQKVTDTARNTSITLRTDTGRPLWAGGAPGGGGQGSGRGAAPARSHTPGRGGGGRMGR